MFHQYNSGNVGKIIYFRENSNPHHDSFIVDISLLSACNPLHMIKTHTKTQEVSIAVWKMRKMKLKAKLLTYSIVAVRVHSDEL